MRRILLTSICLIYLSNTLFTQSGNLLFDDTLLHEIRLSFEEAAFWDTLTSNYLAYRSFSGSDIPLSVAKIQIDGHTLDSIGVRLRGKSSYGYATELKKPFKLDLNEFISGQHYNGIKKINLHNGACDPSMLRDFIALNVMRTAGVKAPRVAHCQLYINDTYWGLYTMIEQVDKTFVENNFSNGKGGLYKNNDWSSLEWLGSAVAPYQEIFEKKTNETEDWGEFIEFVDILNNVSNENFETEIQKVFNVDNYLKVLAVDVALDNWDSYIVNRRNWYLYHNPTTDLFEWIPWDYNLSMGGFFSTSGNPYRSYNEDCPFRSDYYYFIGDSTVQFFDRSTPKAHTWAWDFGDGTTSNLQNPEKKFEVTNNIEVCLTAQSDINGVTCEFTRCQKIDFNFNPSNCFSIESELNPHSPTDPKNQIVLREDQFCCGEGWDNLCEEKYQNLLTENDPLSSIDLNFDLKNLPLITTDTTKTLIRRIMAVPTFRARYFDLMCNLLQTNYTQERLQTLITKQAALIRPAIYEDPNYIFTRDHFEYDAGDGTGGGGGAEIPALNHFFNLKLPLITGRLNEVMDDCGVGSKVFTWQDLTINEFMAINKGDDDDDDEKTGISDENGDHDDWIELYNNTDQAVDLLGFYLSDDLTKPKKWAFPKDAKIDANDFLIVWADKDEDQAGLHTNFKLAGEGEALMLSYEDGTIIDSLTFGEQIANNVQARIPNGTGDFVTTLPSFNEKNEIISATTTLIEAKDFIIYPNPTKGVLTIQVPQFLKDSPMNISLYNILGKRVWQDNFKPISTFTINLPSSPTGTYLLQLEGKGFSTYKKVMIE